LEEQHQGLIAAFERNRPLDSSSINAAALMKRRRRILL